jgi:putative DNA primase/helicase
VPSHSGAEVVNVLTQEQIDNIRQGLGKYATHRRFVARKGKEPIDPITGYGAKANDPTTWGTLDQALHAMDAYDCDGIGVELGEGLCGIDIDHCINEKGEVSEKAEEIVSAIDSYIETSPSGTGMHILFTGSIPEGARRKDGLEMYAEGRYFTLTGEGSGTVANRTEQAAQVHKKYLAPLPAPQRPISPAAQLSISDDELLKKIRASKNSVIVEALWRGDISAYNSPSEADMALCNILAFWTGRDAGQMDRLYRSSGLMREKWDRPQSGSTYGKITIQKAIDECREVYQPGYRKSAEQDFSKVEPEPWEKPTPFDYTL